MSDGYAGGHEQDDAGNYQAWRLAFWRVWAVVLAWACRMVSLLVAQGLLWFGPDDMSGPSLVRAALEQGRQRGVYRRCGSDPAACTSMASFGIPLPRCCSRLTLKVGQLPGFWETLFSRLAVCSSKPSSGVAFVKSLRQVITSWVFKDEPMLEGCTMGLHLPLFDLDEARESLPKGPPDKLLLQVNSDMAVIFRPRPGQQAA